MGGFSHKIIITSTTPIVTPEFSSDLERAPGARSIADENSGVTFGVVELRRCEAYEHFRSHPVLLETLPWEVFEKGGAARAVGFMLRKLSGSLRLGNTIRAIDDALEGGKGGIGNRDKRYIDMHKYRGTK